MYVEVSSVSHQMVSYMLLALKMELYVCGRQPLERHMACGSVSTKLAHLKIYTNKK